MDNMDALKEIHKGCLMGLESITQLEKKVENKSFKKNLHTLGDMYRKFLENIDNLYNNYSLEDLDDLNIFLKTMIDFMLNLKILTDNSDSKIADILIQGMNMGITEGRKIINNKRINNKVKNIIYDFINQQEDMINTLNNYL